MLELMILISLIGLGIALAGIAGWKKRSMAFKKQPVEIKISSKRRW